MIIFGTKSKKRTIERGTFLCPSCKTDQPYHHMTMQKHGHLYFISLVPMGDEMEVVECQTCSNMWDPGVLQAQLGPGHGEPLPAAQTLLDVLNFVTISDGHIADEEVDSMAALYESIVGLELSQARADESMKRVIDEIQDQTFHLNLAAQQHVLEEDIRGMIVKAALFVAVSDGEFHEREAQSAAIVAQSFGFTPEQFETMMEELVAAAASDDDLAIEA